MRKKIPAIFVLMLMLTMSFIAIGEPTVDYSINGNLLDDYPEGSLIDSLEESQWSLDIIQQSIGDQEVIVGDPVTNQPPEGWVDTGPGTITGSISCDDATPWSVLESSGIYFPIFTPWIPLGIARIKYLGGYSVGGLANLHFENSFNYRNSGGIKLSNERCDKFYAQGFKGIWLKYMCENFIDGSTTYQLIIYGSSDHVYVPPDVGGDGQLVSGSLSMGSGGNNLYSD